MPFPLIWIIDDDPIARLLISKKLEKDEICDSHKEFSDGKMALDTLLSITDKKELPNLLLLDLNMPELNGWDFIDIMKAKNEETDFYREIQVAILTSSIDNKDKAKAESHPCVKAFLKKPLNKDALAILSSPPFSEKP